MPPEDKAADRELAREWETLRNLSKAVREATEKVDADREANEARIEASVRKMRWFRRTAVLAVAASGLAGWAGWRANTTVDALRAQRNVTRIVACEANNETAAKINRLGTGVEAVLDIAVPPNPARTPAQQQSVDRFLAQSKAAIEAARIPRRDCSPAAVERFYSKK